MIVVSDASPLNYLVLIDAVDILPALFGRVLTPPAVWCELHRDRTPEAVRQWASQPPPWLEV
jgi:predicted nucleic acid-binding protein